MSNQRIEKYSYAGQDFEFRWSSATEKFTVMRLTNADVSVGWSKVFTARTYEDGKTQAIAYLSATKS